MRLSRVLLLGLFAALALTALLGPAGAALRSAPAWWDPDGAGTGQDWHYRVPVTLPSTSSVNSTARVDIDFAVLMTQLDIAGTFDTNSIRVVRPGGSPATVQEFTDRIHAGASDPAGNARGEVRWIVQDGGAQTYYVYFDITQNGTKSASGLTPINGNFEHSAIGTQLPAGWASATRSNSAYDIQVRPSETVSVTSNGNPSNNPYTTDGTPQTGSFSYLLGARSNNEPGNSNVQQPNTSVLTRTFTVPATNPGNLTVNWRVEGWDAESYDNLNITIAGSTTTTVVGNSLGSYTTWPNAPNIGGSEARNNSAGYGHYNGYDMTTGGTHQNGMTVALRSERWWSRSVSLNAYAGQTVTLTIATNSTELYKSWYHVDNIEWSVVSGTLGSAEGFGVAATSPAAGRAPGEVLTVRATVDARPTGPGNPVTADILDILGATVASGIRLYNDATHGDATANDAIWTNDGSDEANPTYTIPLSAGSASGWAVGVQARDASTSTLGSAFNGMVHRSGQGTALVPANWWNIDVASFSVDAAAIGVTKSMSLVADGVNAGNVKAIPGATLRYCVTIGNTGTASATTLVGTDPLPSGLTYVADSMASGSDCANASTAEDDNATGTDETDPVGASFSAGTVTITRAALASSTSFAVTYRVTVN